MGMSESEPGPAAGPRHVVTYDFTPALGRAVFRSYFWRRYAGMAISSVIVLVFSLILLGSRDLKLLAAFLLGIDVATWSSWIRLHRAAGKQGEKLSPPTVRITLSDEGLDFESIDGTANLRWSGFRGVLRLEPAWLLERPDGLPPWSLPTAALTLEARGFIEQRIRESGGWVR